MEQTLPLAKFNVVQGDFEAFVFESMDDDACSSTPTRSSSTASHTAFTASGSASCLPLNDTLSGPFSLTLSKTMHRTSTACKRDAYPFGFFFFCC